MLGCFSFLLILFRDYTLMINGVSISELRSVEQTHRAHFRRLKQIIAQPAAPQSDPEMAQVVRTRKQNHKQWLQFKKNRQTGQLKRENEAQRLKLQRIRMGNSIYGCQSRSFNNSVAHNFYNRKKLEVKIDSENPEIAKRLIQMQAYINTAKTQQGYGKMKEIMARLEKFPLIDRLSSFSHKNKHLRTEGDIPSPHLPSPTGTRNFSVPRRARGHF